MSSFSRFTEGSSPLAWWRGQPVYLSAYLAIFALGSMVLTAFVTGFAPNALEHLVFSHTNFWSHFKVWTPLTYLIVNPISLWTVLTAVMWWKFGSEVERHMGRSDYLKLLGVVLVTSLVTTSLVTLLGYSMVLASVHFLEWSVFVAFATLFAHARVSIFIATVPVRAIAGVFLALGLLQALSSQQWLTLALYTTSTLATVAFLTHWQGRWKLVMKSGSPSPVPQPTRSSPPPKPAKSKARGFHGSVDDLLDKISQKGMQSLSEEERDFLHQQSRKLAEKKE